MTRPFEIRKEISLPAGPDEVWRAITTTEGLAAWFMPMPLDAEGDEVKAWQPGERLSIETPAGPDGTVHAFEYLIEARDGGSCVLRFVHSGFAGDDWSDEVETGTAFGWDMYLYTLQQYLRHFAGRPAVYIEAEGPAGSGTPEAWAKLREALGVGDGADVGTPVRLTVGEAGTLEGTVDYLNEGFVGVRTGDALVRVHGRHFIGMSPAVSHHAYDTGIDPERWAAAWSSWLGGATG